MCLYDHLQALDSDFPDCILLVGDEVADMLDQSDDAPDEETSYPPSFYGCVSPPVSRVFCGGTKDGED